MKYLFFAFFALASVASAWLPFQTEQPALGTTRLSIGWGRSIKRLSSSYDKIRGVNLGSLFIIEPWMASQEWSEMGCKSVKSEFDCVALLGQEPANLVFAKHWDTWITETDLDNMKEYGINTVRVPVGYWFVEDIVYSDSENFPQGGMLYLDRLAEWAAIRNIYVILDLHGAPGAQEPKQPFTGQYASTAGFYESWQYERAYRFLEAMTKRIHTNNAYRTTGMLEVLNEPQRNHPDLVTTYYATAYQKIRDAESELNVSSDKQLTIQFMDSAWGAGNPKDVLGNATNVAYDDHRYLKYSSIEQTKESYINTSCSDTFGKDGNTLVIIGEWSLAVDSSQEWSDMWNPTTKENQKWYTRWWAAQAIAYEKQMGWVFWSWKTQLGDDWRWSYSAAVDIGVIPKDPTKAADLAGC